MNNNRLRNELKDKNILYITHDYITFTKDQIETLSPNLNNIYVLPRYNRITDLSKVLPIKRLKIRGKDNIINPSALPLNIQVIPTPVVYFSGDSQYKKAGEKHYKAVEKILKKGKIEIDLIHSHFVWSSGYVGLKLKEKYGLPLIITAHGYDIYDIPFRDLEWRMKITSILNSADYIITVSNSNLGFIRKLDIRTPVKVIPNGFKKEVFFPRDKVKCQNELGLPKDKRIILTVGNLLEVKGHRYLIDAMAKIVGQRKDVLAVIIGAGKLEAKLHRQISDSNLKNHVILAGKRPHSEIPLWMNACDLYVQPSLDESFGVVIVEAMACGKPVVGTRTGGIPEIINNEKVGILVEPKNGDKLAFAVEKALFVKWDAQKLVDNSRQYTWDNIAKKILDTYCLTI